MSFGANLRRIRLEKGYTQEELAKKINTSRSNIANYEVDKNKPSLEMLNKLSEVLGVSSDVLLGNSSLSNDTMLKIGLDMKKYNPPTEAQKKQIEEFARFVLKDNKKE